MACAKRAAFIEKGFEMEFSQRKLDLSLYYINKYLCDFVEKTLQRARFIQRDSMFFSDRYKYKKTRDLTRKKILI